MTENLDDVIEKLAGLYSQIKTGLGDPVLREEVMHQVMEYQIQVPGFSGSIEEAVSQGILDQTALEKYINSEFYGWKGMLRRLVNGAYRVKNLLVEYVPLPFAVMTQLLYTDIAELLFITGDIKYNPQGIVDFNLDNVVKGYSNTFGKAVPLEYIRNAVDGIDSPMPRILTGIIRNSINWSVEAINNPEVQKPETISSRVSQLYNQLYGKIKRRTENFVDYTQAVAENVYDSDIMKPFYATLSPQPV